MLKRVLLVWYCCAALLILHGQGIKKTITLTFNENDFVYQQSTEGRLTLYSKSGKSFYSDDSNSPAIPYFTYNVLIGPQQTCSGINATEGLRVVQSNVEMSKSPRCKTRENPGMDSPDDNIIAGESAIVDMKNINLAGFNVVRITISPYRYDPSSRILFLRDTVSICLTLDSSNLQRNRTNFEETKEGVWIDEHAHEYGFIIRFPEGKKDFTGYEFEPWHLRYVGKELAGHLRDSGECLEEYLGITSEYK